ncbi:MAG: DNA recombination protein RmuC [candidate division WOR-3 bacterium]
MTILRRSAGSSPEALILMQKQLEGLRLQLAESLRSTSDLVARQVSDLQSQVSTHVVALNQQLHEQLTKLELQMQGTTRNISDRLDRASEVIGGVQRGLGELTGTTQRIIEVGQDIAQLQQVLQAPKLRGQFGETILSDLLGQILPRPYFELQYRFSTGDVVDAVIRLGDRLVPVDAKFPLDNFRRLQASPGQTDQQVLYRQFARDVRRHIEIVARKYILPDEGTFEFALMFVPAENIYYEIITKTGDPETESLSALATSQRVILVSPNTLYAYLQAIVLGLRGFQIEKRADEVMKYIARLGGDLSRFREDFDRLGKHLADARNRYEDSDRRLTRLEDKLGQALLSDCQQTADAKVIATHLTCNSDPQPSLD